MSIREHEIRRDEDSNRRTKNSGVSTYDLEPEKLRAAILTVLREPNRVLLLAGEGSIEPCELLSGTVKAFPDIKGGAYRASLDPFAAKYSSPYILDDEFCACETVKDAVGLAQREIGEDTSLEVVNVTREPDGIGEVRPSIIAEDVKAVVERRGGHRFFKG